MASILPIERWPRGLQRERVQVLARGSAPERRGVLYWMQTSMRTQFNHSLEYAIATANYLEQPLHVICVGHDPMAGSTARSARFWLEGVVEAGRMLHDERGVSMHLAIAKEDQAQIVGKIAQAMRSSVLVMDRAYTKAPRSTREAIVRGTIESSIVQVESDVVVPIETASDKQEHAARTIRPKIVKVMNNFLESLDHVEYQRKGAIDPPKVEGISWIDLSDCSAPRLEEIFKLYVVPTVDELVAPIDLVSGGWTSARKELDHFLGTKRGKEYAIARNHPNNDEGQSRLSPYLRFGHISPVEIALEARSRTKDSESLKAFLEELIVRRELAHNFVWFCKGYDTYEGAVPAFAKKTFHDHINDKREYVYSYEQFEKGKTHDAYWNAAQLQMVHTGRMHGYMRMYWGKKIIEWTTDPAVAFKHAIDLNNKYELDGGGPNAFCGVSWVFGLHDQGWKEREIFGKVRFMNAKGLERKFDIKGYVAHVDSVINKGHSFFKRKDVGLNESNGKLSKKPKA